MNSESSFDVITLILTKIRVFSGRPEIQVQILAIVLSLLFAAIITRILKRTTLGAVNRWFARRKHPVVSGSARLISLFLQMVSFPIFGFVFLTLARRTLDNLGWISGLLSQFGWVLLTLLVFQVALTVIYLIFDEHEVQRYHHRLLLPLFIVVITLEILSDLIDLNKLASLEVLTFFERPVTLGAIFIATFGLYFWTDAVHGVQDLVFRVLTRNTTVDPGSTQATLTLVRYALIILGIFYAFSQLSLDSTSVAAITGGLSVGVGFGLREILSNFVSGLLLLFERSLHPGDVIEFDGEFCVVERFSIRATTVRTLNNVELVIPNQMFFTAPFRTYTGTDHTIRVPIIVKTDCVIDARHVQAVIQQTVVTHEHVLEDPAPSVFILDYGDNVATFQVNIWLGNPLLSPKTVSDVRIMIWDAFDLNGISLPTPEVEVHFSNREPLVMGEPVQHRQPQPVVAEGAFS